MRAFHRLIHPLRLVANALLPSQCLLCGASLGNQLLCSGCASDLPWIERHPYHCKQCGLALSSPADFCGQCLGDPPAFRRSFIPFAYEYPLVPLLHRFKYSRKLTGGKLLGQLFAQYIVNCAETRADWHRPDLLLPAPIHWTRRWQRGFNQAELLSHYLSRATGIVSDSYLLRRKERRSAQQELTRRERQTNLQRAFALAPRAETQIRGKCVALVDDVVTTTATVRELSRLLSRAGATEIQVWALARTMERYSK